MAFTTCKIPWCLRLSNREAKDSRYRIMYSGKGKYNLKMNGEAIAANRIRDFLVVDNVGSGKYTFELNLINP